MDFRNAKELLKVCQEQGLSISAVMLQRELTEGEQDPEETDRKMDRVLEIMKSAASTPIHTPVKSMGGLIGGEAKKIASRYHSGFGICGDLLEKSKKDLRSQRYRKRSLRRSSGKSCHLRDGNSGNQCFHGCDRSFPDCRICRYRSGTSACPPGNL